jgi:hypothetical protein
MGASQRPIDSLQKSYWSANPWGGGHLVLQVGSRRLDDGITTAICPNHMTTIVGYLDVRRAHSKRAKCGTYSEGRKGDEEVVASPVNHGVCSRVPVSPSLQE